MNLDDVSRPQYIYSKTRHNLLIETVGSYCTRTCSMDYASCDQRGCLESRIRVGERSTNNVSCCSSCCGCMKCGRIVANTTNSDYLLKKYRFNMVVACAATACSRPCPPQELLLSHRCCHAAPHTAAPLVPQCI